MAKINPELIRMLQRKLGVSQRHVYTLISEKANARFLQRDLAAIAVAAENGINITKYSTQDQLNQLRASSNALTEAREVVTTTQPAGTRKRSSQTLRRSLGERTKRRGTSVFVVHGRNERLRKSMFAFLRSIGLQPIEWQKAIALTKKATPYVGEILDAAFRQAAAIVILLTPDDEARLKQEFLKSNDPYYEKELTGQSRPNVLFEAGMAMGRNPDSTILVQVGEARPFSDIGGRHVVHLSKSPESRSDLITKLSNAGCNVDTSGTDWYSEGDFTLP